MNRHTGRRVTPLQISKLLRESRNIIYLGVVGWQVRNVAQDRGAALIALCFARPISGGRHIARRRLWGGLVPDISVMHVSTLQSNG